MGEFVEITTEDGAAFEGYLALPTAGTGPGLLIFQEIFGVNDAIQATADYFAEEGYVVLAPDMFWRLEPRVSLGYSDAEREKAFDYYGRFDFEAAARDMQSATSFLADHDAVKGKGKGGATQVAALGYCLGGALAYQAAAHCDLAAAISYYGVAIEKQLGLKDKISCPLIFHCGGEDTHVPPEAVEEIRAAFADRDDVMVHVYDGAPHAFANRFRESYDKAAAGMAHSRSLALLRSTVGPVYDLEHLWEMHCFHEFEERDVDATMKTMVAEPYVNHVPTMTGGVGYQHLHRFYKNHFVNSNPEDTQIIPMSRTVGSDRVVDEVIFTFTHDREIDWMLPGIPPTGKRVEVPLIAVINFRGDKLYHEHIYWDQASVLAQIGLLDPAKLPIAGKATADKVMDETLPSNELMPAWQESAAEAAE